MLGKDLRSSAVGGGQADPQRSGRVFVHAEVIPSHRDGVVVHRPRPAAQLSLRVDIEPGPSCVERSPQCGLRDRVTRQEMCQQAAGPVLGRPDHWVDVAPGSGGHGFTVRVQQLREPRATPAGNLAGHRTALVLPLRLNRQRVQMLACSGEVTVPDSIDHLLLHPAILLPLQGPVPNRLPQTRLEPKPTCTATNWNQLRRQIGCGYGEVGLG